MLSLAAAGLNAQDTIVKKSGDVLKVKVLEVGTDEIKFRSAGSADGPIIAIKRSEVKKVIVSGQVIINDKEDEKPKSEDVLIKQDGTLLKVNVLEIGTTEVKFKLLSDPDGPSISIPKSEVRSLKVGDVVVIDNKKESEDIITRMDGSSLKVKVLQIGTDQVIYKLYGNPDGPTLSIKKKEVRTIKVDNQVVYEYKEDPYTVSNNSILNKTNDIKMDFFAPLFNHLAFSYEWMVRPSFNMEMGLGIIGVGVSNVNVSYYRGKPKGVYLRGGPKFLLGSASDIEIEGSRIAHPLKGRYFSIEAILNTMSRGFQADESVYNQSTGTYTTTHYTWDNRYQSLALEIIYGRQNIYGNAITVGYYIGFGYAFESIAVSSGTAPPSYTNNSYAYYNPQRYSHIFTGRDFPLAFTYGITIGYIHKGPDKKGDKSYRNNPRAPK
jgi:hypothetical protein